MSVSQKHWHCALCLRYNLAMTEPIARLHTPTRLLCGPGPSNVHPQVLEAMQQPMLGHLDPELPRAARPAGRRCWRRAYRRDDGLTHRAVGQRHVRHGGRHLASLIEPGDTVIVGVAGFFGSRIVEIARRHGASVVEVRVAVRPGGRQRADPGRAANGIPRPRLVAVVHAETSTGVRPPAGGAGRGHARLRRAADGRLRDLAGRRSSWRPERWGVDYCYSCTRSAWARLPASRRVPALAAGDGADRRAHDAGAVLLRLRAAARSTGSTGRPSITTPCRSLQYYALYEALRLALEEGLEARWAAPRRRRRPLPAGHRATAASSCSPSPSCSSPPLSAVLRARRHRRQGGTEPAAGGARASRSAAGSARTPRRSGGSA